ncbi:MAG TPA: MlaD family protein [Marmoricola sp.]|nr:MlaD family protein [Marmoricola sp.]
MRRFRILAGLALITTLALVASSCMPFTAKDLKVTAYFADSSGLFVGNDVGVLGVSVGKITKITPQGDQVRVEMEIDADQKVPVDAGAVVVARSVATDRYVELTPVYKSGPTMKSGAVIEEQRTKTPVDFDTVLASLNTLAKGLTGTPGNEQLVGDAVNNLAEAIGGALRLLAVVPLVTVLANILTWTSVDPPDDDRIPAPLTSVAAPPAIVHVALDADELM